jgi:hypothetical protein
MLFVSKPQTVEAIHWTGDNWDEVTLFAPEKVHLIQGRNPSRLELLAGDDGSQEWVPVPVGHWLVHRPGDLSDIWPISDDYFQEKYDEFGHPTDPQILT